MGCSPPSHGSSFVTDVLARPFARHALRLLDDGFPVGPVNGKVPVTARGCYGFTRDLDTLIDYMQQYGEHNVAIRCDGMTVLDADDPDSAAWLEAEATTYNAPFTRTAAGGHAFFLGESRTAVKVEVAPGIRVDVRSGMGAYVVARGSVHESGITYTASPSHPPLSRENLPPLPEPLREKLLPARSREQRQVEAADTLTVSKKTAYLDAAARNIVARMSLALPGTRNATLCREAFGLGRLVGNMEHDTGQLVLRQLGQAALSTGLPRHEIGRVLNRAFCTAHEKYPLTLVEVEPATPTSQFVLVNGVPAYVGWLRRLEESAAQVEDDLPDSDSDEPLQEYVYDPDDPLTTLPLREVDPAHFIPVRVQLCGGLSFWRWEDGHTTKSLFRCGSLVCDRCNDVAHIILHLERILLGPALQQTPSSVSASVTQQKESKASVSVSGHIEPNGNGRFQGSECVTEPTQSDDISVWVGYFDAYWFAKGQHKAVRVVRDRALDRGGDYCRISTSSQVFWVSDVDLGASRRGGKPLSPSVHVRSWAQLERWLWKVLTCGHLRRVRFSDGWLKMRPKEEGEEKEPPKCTWMKTLAASQAHVPDRLVRAAAKRLDPTTSVGWWYGPTEADIQERAIQLTVHHGLSTREGSPSHDVAIAELAEYMKKFTPPPPTPVTVAPYDEPMLESAAVL
jgi:hypothetical protein